MHLMKKFISEFLMYNLIINYFKIKKRLLATYKLIIFKYKDNVN